MKCTYAEKWFIFETWPCHCTCEHIAAVVFEQDLPDIGPSTFYLGWEKGPWGPPSPWGTTGNEWLVGEGDFAFFSVVNTDKLFLLQ